MRNGNSYLKGIIIAIICFLSVAQGFAQHSKPVKIKWQRLFNGKNLKGWTPKIKDHVLGENFANTFSADSGMIRVNYQGYDEFKEQYGHLFYKKKLSAYLLVVEYRFHGEQVKGGPGWAIRNSGAMLHCQDPASMKLEQDFPISIEAQFLGGNGKDARSTNNLCTPGTNVILNDKLFMPHCVTSSSKTYHGDQWVRAELLVLGDSIIKHIVEGDTVIMYTKPQYDDRDPWVKGLGLKGGESIKEGYISLQSESHPVDFRKVELLDLSAYLNNPSKLRQILSQVQNRKQ